MAARDPRSGLGSGAVFYQERNIGKIIHFGSPPPEPQEDEGGSTNPDHLW